MIASDKKWEVPISSYKPCSGPDPSPLSTLKANFLHNVIKNKAWLFDNVLTKYIIVSGKNQVDAANQDCMIANYQPSSTLILIIHTYIHTYIQFYLTTLAIHNIMIAYMCKQLIYRWAYLPV